MSMINDALKRAKAAQPKNAAPAGPSLQQVEPASAPAARANFWLPIIIGVVLLLAGLLLWQWFVGTVRVRAKSVPGVEASQPALAKAVSTRAATGSISETATNAAVATAKPHPPAYKLQSIFYFAKDPCAMINGKSVYRGDRVGDARVTNITEDSATIVTDAGETKTLLLRQDN